MRACWLCCKGLTCGRECGDVEVHGGRARLSNKQDNALVTLTAAHLVHNSQTTGSNLNASHNRMDKSPAVESSRGILCSGEKERTPSMHKSTKCREIMSNTGGTGGHTVWFHEYKVQEQEKLIHSDGRQNSPYSGRRYKGGLTCCVS